MSEKEFVAQMASQIKSSPDKIDIPEVQAFSTEISQKKAENFLRKFDSFKIASAAKFHKVQNKERTLYQLANNARLETHHLSGALRFVSGFEPMEDLFQEMMDKRKLTEQIETIAKKFDIAAFTSKNESIEFERLWQIKAAAVSQEGVESNQVLCRSIGAYRHFVNKVPVLGAASATIKLTGSQAVDAFSVFARSTSSKSLGSEKVISPDESAKRIYKQLAALGGKTKTPVYEMAKVQSFQFGYMNSSKRSSQNFLIPIVMAVIDLESKDFPQGYVLVAPATDNPKLVPVLRAASPGRSVKRG
jgi:hypothetical protein